MDKQLLDIYEMVRQAVKIGRGAAFLPSEANRQQIGELFESVKQSLTNVKIIFTIPQSDEEGARDREEVHRIPESVHKESRPKRPRT